MTQITFEQCHRNPFATRHVRPGVVDPLGYDGLPLDCETLLERLDRLGKRALILGPHGSGKSTLMERLVPRLATLGLLGDRIRIAPRRPMVRHVDRSLSGIGGDRDSLLGPLKALVAIPRGTILCLDGWELLSSPTRLCLVCTARWLDRGLLVTGHHTGPLPLLIQMRPSEELLSAIVDRLPLATGRITSEDIVSAFRISRGNLREALFHLYDVFEAKNAALNPQRPTSTAVRSDSTPRHPRVGW